MNTLKAIVWLSPVLFMLHDFEEIIFIGAWRKRYEKYLNNSKMKKVPYADFISTASFSIGVAIEFIIFVIVTLLSCYSNNYIAWYGLFFATNFHYVAMHFDLQFRFRHYVPGIITSITFLPLGIYILYIVAKMTNYSWCTIVLSSLIGSIAVMVIVYILHKCMKKFEKWLELFSQEPQKL